jgi:hypothetical protein
MNDDYDPKEDLKMLESLVTTLKENLIESVDGYALSQISKVPAKAMDLRETLYYRITELAETALELYHKEGRLISAFLITRAVHETTALFYWFYEKLEQTVKQKELGDFDDFIMKVLFGWRLKDAEFPEAYNILTAVDKLTKQIDSFRPHYEQISEYCHPNYSGVLGAYATIDRKKAITNFGKDFSRLSPHVGLPPLIASIEVFRLYYNESGDLIPDFIKICEDHVNKSKEKE